MNKAEQILEKHINENNLNFIFHEKKDLWQELLNATNEALGLAHVVGQSEQLKAFLEWQQNNYIKPYDTPIAEQLEDYKQSL